MTEMHRKCYILFLCQIFATCLNKKVKPIFRDPGDFKNSHWRKILNKNIFNIAYDFAELSIFATTF